MSEALDALWNEDGLLDAISAALEPRLTQLLTEARAEALEAAAAEAEERGDIGKDGGYEAWTWLRIRANQARGEA